MRNTTAETHVRYLQPWGKRAAVRLVCTCGHSHGAASWTNLEMALATGQFDYYVPLWLDNPDVTRVCREYAAARPVVGA